MPSTANAAEPALPGRQRCPLEGVTRQWRGAGVDTKPLGGDQVIARRFIQRIKAPTPGSFS